MTSRPLNDRALPGWASTVLSPFAGMYGRVIAGRNRRFDAGEGVVELKEPVISVGNLTVGGTGKTPVCQYIVSVLRNAGRAPAIAMRGYGATSDGVSDEALEYASMFQDLPLAVGADRVAALEELRKKSAFDCIVLDDGFQHRRIARALDIVLIDASRPGLDDRLLPAGRLREDPTSLSRADIVLVARATEVDDRLAGSIAKYSGTPPIAWLEHTWAKGVEAHRKDAPTEIMDIKDLRGARLAVSLGVGNPTSVLNMIEDCGAQVVYEHNARDHQIYTEQRTRRLFATARTKGAEAVLVTPKDWMKLQRWKSSFDDSMPVFVPRLEVRVLEGEDALREMVVEAATLQS